MGLIQPYNAIPSWEGYKYQGNIALYVVLKKIKSLLTQNKLLDGYKVQIEGEEDFALLENNLYLSLHQVKLGAFTLDNNDKFAFIAEIIQNNAKLGYFHIIPQKHIPHNFLKKSREAISELKNEFNKPLVSKQDLSPSDNCNDFIILEKITSNSKKATKYSIIKYKTNGRNDYDSVKNAIPVIINELDQLYTIINNKKRSYLASSPNGNEDECFVKEYNIKFQNINEVKRCAVKIIESIINLKHPDWSYVDDDYCGFVYDQCISLIEQHVTNFSITNNKQAKCFISFEDFYNAIIKEYYKNYDDNLKFKYYLILKNIKEAFIKFKNDKCNISDCDTCVNKATCNLWKQYSEILNRDIENQRRLIFNLLLQEPTDSINNLPSDDDIEVQLLDMLKDSPPLKLNEKNIISALSNEQFYWLSLDDSRKKEKLGEKIKKGIQETPDKSFIFECDTLITGRLNDDCFKIDGSNVNKLEKKQMKEISAIVSNNINDEKNDCNKPKIIRLVDAVTAKGELR